MAQPSGGTKPRKHRSKHPPEHYFEFQLWAREHKPRWVYWAYWIVVAILVRLARVRVIGRENIPRHGGAIVAPNHFSNMDHFVVGVFIPRRIRFVGKSQLFDTPLKGMFKRGGVIPVARGHGGDEEMFRTATMLVERGEAITMYLEGKRSESHAIAERAKPGIGRLALQTGAPILPVAVYGTQFLRYWKQPWKWRRITVKFGQPMPSVRLDRATTDDHQEFADGVLDEVRRLYGEITPKGHR